MIELRISSRDWVRPGQIGSHWKRVWSALGAGALVAGIAFGFLIVAVAQTQPSPQRTAAALDRMIAAHKSQQELAQYVFDTHGCKSCHTVGQNGKLGFTSRGQQVGQGFEGCTRLLTAMNIIAQVPDNRRSADQHQKAARFEEFGCTFCHQDRPGQIRSDRRGSEAHAFALGVRGCGETGSEPAERKPSVDASRG